MESKTTGDWETQYSDRFAYKRVCGDESIKVKRPQDIENARDEWEVIGRLSDEIHHTSHADENEAMEQVMVLEKLADREVTFEQGDEVFVIDEGFETVIQRGYIGYSPDEYRSLPVFVPTDPYHAEKEDGRMIRAQEEQVIHADAGLAESFSFIGQLDLLKPQDFAEVED